MLRAITLLVFVLIIGSPTIGVGQKTLQRVKGRPSTDAGPTLKGPEPRPEDHASVSPSGRLKLSGAHTGLLGILEVEADLSLEGPLRIDVAADGSPVSQRAGDISGRLELNLPRKRRISLVIKLGNGKNLIHVVDSGNRDEKATLEWIVVDPDSRSVVPENAPEPERTESRTIRSASGRLSVTSLHTEEQATLNVVVGTLTGPFSIRVIDESKKVLVAKKKQLQRGETSFAETLLLENGRHLITIASDDSDEKAESVTLGPWSFRAPKAANAETEDAKKVKVSEKANLSASIARVNDYGNLIVHISDRMKGFKIKVVDADNKEIDSRSFSNLDRGTNDWSLSVKAAKGENTVTVSSLDDAESVVLSLPAAAAPVVQGSVQPAANNEEMVEYDWGRVRGYFAAGMVFSKERDDFSHSDIFLDFTLDKNYIARPWFKIWPDGKNGNKHFLFRDLNTFFNARLTSIPVTAEDTTQPDDGEAEEEECKTPDCEAFITSKKAAMMQAGIYAPMYWDFTSWDRGVTRAGSNTVRKEKNALFIAPLAKGGILTVTDDRQTAEATQFGQDDVFNFFSFGAMLGHFRLHTQKKADGSYESNPNIAPELISWLTISAGRWENFEIEVPTGKKNAAGDDINVRRRPWRIEALGRLKIPETPFMIGFDGNFGKGPDDVRFLFGTRFDIGKIMRTLKLASALDNLGGNSTHAPVVPAPVAPNPNPNPNPNPDPSPSPNF